MSKKIYLSPSNQDGNQYAVGNTTEMIQCNRIAQATETALKRCGFIVKRAVQGQTMQTSINESNNWGADVHICIHTNAGGGNGTMVMVYNKADKNMKYANAIYKEVQAVTPGKIDYGVRAYPELAELNSTNAIAVYIEVDFHDDKTIAQWIIDNTTTVGEAICKGICNAYGVTYKTANTSNNSSLKLYRVQVGAFSNKTNAENYLEKVKSAGFSDAYIVTEEK